MNYANSLQLAYNIGDNQQLAYAVLRTIKSPCIPTWTPHLMYRKGPVWYIQNQHANYFCFPCSASHPPCTGYPQGQRTTSHTSTQLNPDGILHTKKRLVTDLEAIGCCLAEFVCGRRQGTMLLQFPILNILHRQCFTEVNVMNFQMTSHCLSC